MAVSIKVIPYNIATDRSYHAIRIYKPMRLRVVVTRLQEVESGFGVVIVTAIPYRVDVGDMGRVGAYVCITAVGYIQQLTSGRSGNVPPR